MIIHISGPSGAGKTTLGNKLKDKYKQKIVVKDLDDLRDKFIKEFYGEKRWTKLNKTQFQKYINSFITKHEKKVIIFVGLNTYPWWHKGHYYNLHSDYNFYIDLKDEVVLKQKCTRLLENVKKDERAMNYLIKDNENFLRMFGDAVRHECSLAETIKMNKEWKKDYNLKGYIFKSREEIFKEVCKLLNS